MAIPILSILQQIISRYIVTSALGLGIFGNLCNCIMFINQCKRQPTPFTIYLLSFSIIAFIYLIWANFPAVYSLDHIDPQTYSIVYCKLRLYGSYTLGTLVRYIIVCACADRYFFTRRNVRIRSWSSIQMARKMLIINCLIWPILAIQILVFMEIRNGVCWMFGLVRFYYSIYQLITVGIIPPTLMSIFGFLSLRSLRQLHSSNEHGRRRDYDLMRMLIAEIIINVTTSIPYSINIIYGAATANITDKSADRLEIESFMNYITTILINLLGIAPFYLFIIASKSFRNEFIQIVIGWYYKYILRSHRVMPMVNQSTAISQVKSEAIIKP